MVASGGGGFKSLLSDQQPFLSYGSFIYYYIRCDPDDPDQSQTLMALALQSGSPTYDRPSFEAGASDPHSVSLYS